MEPTTSAAMTGGSSFITGNCETPYSRMIATAVPTVSCGWVCTKSGSVPFFVASTPPAVASSVSVLKNP